MQPLLKNGHHKQKKEIIINSEILKLLYKHYNKQNLLSPLLYNSLYVIDNIIIIEN